MNAVGYSVVWSGEASKEEEESPLKKYQRLNCEVIKHKCCVNANSVQLGQRVT